MVTVFAHAVRVNIEGYPREMVDWCNENAGVRGIAWQYAKKRSDQDIKEFTFWSEKISMMFALKWL